MRTSPGGSTSAQNKFQREESTVENKERIQENFQELEEWVSRLEATGSSNGYGWKQSHIPSHHYEISKWKNRSYTRVVSKSFFIPGLSSQRATKGYGRAKKEDNKKRRKIDPRRVAEEKTLSKNYSRGGATQAWPKWSETFETLSLGMHGLRAVRFTLLLPLLPQARDSPLGAVSSCLQESPLSRPSGLSHLQSLIGFLIHFPRTNSAGPLSALLHLFSQQTFF